MSLSPLIKSIRWPTPDAVQFVNIAALSISIADVKELLQVGILAASLCLSIMSIRSKRRKDRNSKDSDGKD